MFQSYCEEFDDQFDKANVIATRGSGGGGGGGALAASAAAASSSSGAVSPADVKTASRCLDAAEAALQDLKTEARMLPPAERRSKQSEVDTRTKRLNVLKSQVYILLVLLCV